MYEYLLHHKCLIYNNVENCVITELQQQNVVNHIKQVQYRHVATSVWQLLLQHFCDRIIFHNFVVLRLPSFPDLTFLVLGLFEIKGAYMKYNKFLRIDRFRKTWRCTDSLWNITFGIVFKSVTHTMGYCLRS